MLRFATWKIVSILGMIAVALLLVVPSLLPASGFVALEKAMPSWLKPKTLTLGLDLQGGSHILLRVDRDDVKKTMVANLRDDVRRIMREEKVAVAGGVQAQVDSVQFRLADNADNGKIRPRLQSLANPTASILGSSGAPAYSVDDGGSGTIVVKLTDAGISDRIRRAVDQSIEVIRRRIDALGTTEPLIQREGNDRVSVEVPGLADPQRLLDLLGKTAKLEFRMVADPGESPSEFEMLPQSDEKGELPVNKRVLVDGGDLTNATPGFDQRGGGPDVNFQFNIRGGQRFAQVTSENVNKRFAVVLDGKVITAPNINEPITGGSGQITGSFSVEQANDLAILLRAGALPAKLTVIEQQTVGPGLGQDSINAGKLAAYVGAGLVFAYMLVTYGTFGIFANIALAVHISFIFAGLVLLGATLTLPGIAGIVLTIGMAVDSNVLIYERIREENHAGRSIIQSLDAGFKRAFATIVDSNVTMFVAAAILYFLGAGPVRGFAVSLGLGILTSIVTAVTMTRMMIALWYRYQRPTKLPI